MNPITLTLTPTMTLIPHQGEEHIHRHENTFNEGINLYMATRCGLYHPKNEDSVLASSPFYGVADGVGGGELGDLASRTLLEHCASLTSPLTPSAIVRHVIDADRVIAQTLHDHNGARGASMVSGVWLNAEGKGYATSVGDTRMYQFTTLDGEVHLTQITIDQTYENLNLPTPTGGKGDDPARMVGVGTIGEPPVIDIALQGGEGLLICSDGVHKFLSLEEMEQIATDYLIRYEAHHYAIESIADALVNHAIDNGSYDDTTAMILYYHTLPPSPLSEKKGFWHYVKRFNNGWRQR